MTPDTSAARRIDWLLIETGGNLLVFAVVGFAMLLALRRPAIALLLGVLLSSLAELTQLVVPSRVASLTDVATNGLGTVVGVLAGSGVARWMRHRAVQRSEHR